MKGCDRSRIAGLKVQIMVMNSQQYVLTHRESAGQKKSPEGLKAFLEIDHDKPDPA